MAIYLVDLILDLTDGTSAPLNEGYAYLTPSAILTDSTDHGIATESPIGVNFAPSGNPVVTLISTDSNYLPAGWAWYIKFQGPGGPTAWPAPFNFPLLANPQSFTATSATPCVFTVPAAPANGTMVELLGTSLPAGFTAETTYFVVNAGSMTFQLSATLGGAAIASTSTGSGTVQTSAVYLSAIAPVTSATSFQAYLPLPAGTPASGQVPVATGLGEASNWGTVAINPMTAPGDMIYGGTAGASTRLAGDVSNIRRFLREQSTSGTANPPVWDALQSGDLTGAALLAGATFTGYLAPAVSALTFGASIAVNAALGNVFTLTLTASTGTIANPSNPVDGQIIRFRIAQDGTGSRTVAWGTAYDFGTAGAPTLSTGASKVDVVAFEYNAALSKWMYLGAPVPQGF